MSSEDTLISPIPYPENWQLVKLKDITQKIGSGATPTGGQAAYLETRANFALIRSQNIFDRTFSEVGLAFISDLQAEGLKGVKLQKDDILLNITGDGVTFGRACTVPSKILPACVNQHVSIIRLNKDAAVPGYVVSYLTHPTIKSYIESFNAGGSRRAITKSHIESFVIPLPPIDVQTEIAQILDAFDNRIAVLRETNSTLEAIAQALFKSWFVDFDPVHANAGTQAPSLPPEIQALFPSTFIDTYQGPIPEGWSIGHIGDFAVQKKGSVNPLSQPETLFEHFSLPAFDNQQAPVLELGKEIKSNKTPLPKETVLLSKLNPHIPRLWLPIEYGGTAVCSTEFLAYSPKGASSKEFIYCAFSSEKFTKHLCQLVTGTSNSHQRVKPDQVLLIETVLPSDEIFKQFELIANPIFAQIHKNRVQSQTLATLRDTLLPRLVSGQLRLPESDRELSEVI